MRKWHASLVWVVTATAVPPWFAYASDTARSPAEAVAGPPQLASVPETPFLLGTRTGHRSLGLRLKLDPPVDSSLPGDLRYDPADRGAAAPAVRFSPVAGAEKAGWHFSGRVGPLRWLTPLDGEGDTKIRLGGRVSGQPRTPGMGIFSLGIHYTFE